MPVIKRLPVKVYLSFGMRFSPAKFFGINCVSFYLNTADKGKFPIVVYDTRTATINAMEEFQKNRVWKKMLEAISVPALVTINRQADEKSIKVILESPAKENVPEYLLALTAFSITNELECEISQAPNKGLFVWNHKFVSENGILEQVILTITGPNCKIAIKPVSEIPRHKGEVFVFDETVTIKDEKDFFPPD